ncbi:hypothetical protein HPULCUR_004291 [Helicostylum pulchrum]|uniref:Uncharacterized protein n=1 Tax=Helicostylum pulchrum TaxID=562976 RepID=A0ABP9XVS1_9FUNG
MGHFDQHNDFFADPNFAKNPVDRQKLSLIMNKSTEELTSFLESHPAFRTNTKKALPDTVNQSSSVSSSMDCYGHHTGKKKPIVEITTNPEATTTDSEITVSSEATDNTSEVKIKIQPGHGIKCICINFGTA